MQDGSTPEQHAKPLTWGIRVCASEHDIVRSNPVAVTSRVITDFSAHSVTRTDKMCVNRSRIV